MLKSLYKQKNVELTRFALYTAITVLARAGDTSHYSISSSRTITLCPNS